MRAGYRRRGIHLILEKVAKVPQVNYASLVGRLLTLVGNHAGDDVADALCVALVLQRLSKDVG